MRRFAIILAIIFCFEGTAYSLNLFKKKYDENEEEKLPMVQTVDEWMESATSLKMDMRKRGEDTSKKDENVIPPAQRPLYITKYNVAAGSRDLDLSNIIKTKNVRSIFVADPNFENAVYSEVYYYPQTQQIASTLYLIELDGYLDKKERLSDVSVFEHTRYPLISTALPYLRQDFFSTLTLVDFSSDGKKILVKEKRGSSRYGIYETYVWIYSLTKEIPENDECYRNNINFSNEVSSYIPIKNGSGIINTPPDEILASDFSLTNEEFDISSIQTLNDKNDISGADKFPLKTLSYKDVNNVLLTDNPETNSKYAKINYKDLNNSILSVWKEQARVENPILTSRWHDVFDNSFKTNENYEAKNKNIGYGVRLNLLNEMIKAYWFDRQKLILNHIRWDLKPLGFSKSNSDEIIVDAYAWGKDGQKISLGRFAVNINDGLPRLVNDSEEIEIEANGFIVIPRLNQ